MNELKEILRLDRKELLHSFEKSSITGKGTPEQVADAREVALRNFLEKYFPFPYRICKGIISDSYGNRSNSIDSIVINPTHPNTIAANSNPFFLGVEGVDYAIELKPCFNSTKEIKRGLSQIRSVKRLKRRKARLLLSGSEKNLDKSFKVPCVIFCEKTYKNPHKLKQTVVSYYIKNQIPKDEQVDIICCLDGTFVVNSSEEKFLYYEVDDLIYTNLGEDVLYYLLYFLAILPQSALRMQSDVYIHYIDSPQIRWRH